MLKESGRFFHMPVSLPLNACVLPLTTSYVLSSRAVISFSTVADSKGKTFGNLNFYTMLLKQGYTCRRQGGNAPIEKVCMALPP